MIMDFTVSLGLELPSNTDPDCFNKFFDMFKKLGTRKPGLFAVKIRKLMESLTPCKLEEIGTTKWLKKMNKLMMISSAIDLDREKFTKDMIETKKIAVVIHDMVLIALWIGDIKHQLVTAIKREKRELGDRNWEFCTSTAALIVRHYECCVWTISTLLHNPEAVRQLGADAMDIITFAMCTLVSLLEQARLITEFNDFLPSMDPMVSEEANIEFDKFCGMAMAGVLCLFHLVKNLDKLRVEAVTHLLHPEIGLIETVVDLIEEQPWWCSRTIRDQFRNWQERPETIPREPPFIETNCKIADFTFDILHELLIVQSKKVPAVLDFTTNIFQRLMELLVPLTKYPAVVAKKSGLPETKQFLEHLRLNPPPSVNVTNISNTNSSSHSSPCPSAPYHTSIQAEIAEKKEVLINAHVAEGTFVSSRREEILERLNHYFKCFTEDMNNNCFNCGKPDPVSRCSKCQYAHYCSGKCQLDDWKKHKRSCHPKQPQEVRFTFLA